jgi:hypothetical protein
MYSLKRIALFHAQITGSPYYHFLRPTGSPSICLSSRNWPMAVSYINLDSGFDEDKNRDPYALVASRSED